LPSLATQDSSPARSAPLRFAPPSTSSYASTSGRGSALTRQGTRPPRRRRSVPLGGTTRSSLERVAGHLLAMVNYLLDGVCVGPRRRGTRRTTLQEVRWRFPASAPIRRSRPVSVWR